MYVKEKREEKFKYTKCVWRLSGRWSLQSMRNIFSDHTALTLKWCFNPTWVFKWFGCPPSSTKDMLFKLYEVCMDVLLLCTWTQHYRQNKLEQLNYSPSASSHRTFVSTSSMKSCIVPPNCYGNYTIWILGSHYAGACAEYWVSILKMPSFRRISECVSTGYWLKITLLLFCGNTSDKQLL